MQTIIIALILGERATVCPGGQTIAGMPLEATEGAPFQQEVITQPKIRISKAIRISIVEGIVEGHINLVMVGIEIQRGSYISRRQQYNNSTSNNNQGNQNRTNESSTPDIWEPQGNDSILQNS